MSRKKVFKCPFCKKQYVVKESLYNHMSIDHPESVRDLPPSQVFFNYRNRYDINQRFGKCIMDRRPTQWNEITERYERLCSEKCRVDYREMFRKRMQKRHGKDHLLDSPEQQQRMLENRRISGVYKWSNGKNKFKYVGSYEKDFLEYLDKNIEWSNPESIHAPAPQIINYKHNGKKSFYMPDFYLESLGADGKGMIIEIKSKTNKHYRERDIAVEKAKDRAMKASGYNYLKIYDKDYREFDKIIENMK